MFSLPDASRYLDTTLLNPKNPAEATRAGIDTRTLQAGEMFVALPGTRMDGHDCLAEAFQKGAAGALVQHDVFFKRWNGDQARQACFFNVLAVDNVLTALQRLAAWHRRRFHIPRLAITGSVGKTTTKEFLYYCLTRSRTGIANPGNFNNHLGVPLTLLALEPKHRFLVCEMGANHRGEIAALCELVQPTGGILTAIAPSHLAGFGSLAEIMNTKCELPQSLAENAPIIIPDDDEALAQKIAKLPARKIRVGFSAKADYQICRAEREDRWVRFQVKGQPEFRFPGSAVFLAKNAAMALALCDQMGIPLADLPELWEGLSFPSGRFQTIPLPNQVTAIDDTYNASPMSFEHALQCYREMQTSGRKGVVFGDMLELGAEAGAYHATLGRQLAAGDFDYVLGFGPQAKTAIAEMRAANPGATAKHFEDADALAHDLFQMLQAGDTLLFKGSRSMHVEKVLTLLTAHLQEPKRAVLEKRLDLA